MDKTWNPVDLCQFVHYLRVAPVMLCTSEDPQPCRFCGELIGEVGTWRWDNKWFWPQTIAHYVERHFVRLPDKMVADIRRMNYIPPTDEECDDKKMDELFWAMNKYSSEVSESEEKPDPGNGDAAWNMEQ